MVERQGSSLQGQQGGASPGHSVHLDGQEDLLSTALTPAWEGHDVAGAVPWDWMVMGLCEVG